VVNEQEVRVFLGCEVDGRLTQIDRRGETTDFPGIRDLEPVQCFRRVRDFFRDAQVFVQVLDDAV
jgi:hypothetical protein